MKNRNTSESNRIIFTKNKNNKYSFEIEHSKNKNYIETNIEQNQLIDELKVSLFVTDYSNIEKIIFNDNFSKKEKKELKEIVNYNINLSKEANDFVSKFQTTIYLMEEVEKSEKISNIINSLYQNKNE